MTWESSVVTRKIAGRRGSQGLQNVIQALDAAGLPPLCWVHAERLVHDLVPANDKQRNAVVVAKRMMWCFYRR
jgi:hypothetical protein